MTRNWEVTISELEVALKAIEQAVEGVREGLKEAQRYLGLNGETTLRKLHDHINFTCWFADPYKVDPGVSARIVTLASEISVRRLVGDILYFSVKATPTQGASPNGNPNARPNHLRSS